jgi:hypothetical protein
MRQALLIATLIHDIGMLSQNPIDLPSNVSYLRSKANSNDIATWVRETHVDRLESLTAHITSGRGHDQFINQSSFEWGVTIAKAHQSWSWEWRGKLQHHSRHRGLAAILAVADLLDEDAARCDTNTLLLHREGSELNKAHWLRHSLTVDRVVIMKGQIEVAMVRPSNTSRIMEPVYSALRNHFRAITLYRDDLATLGAEIVNIHLDPATGVPTHEEPTLDNWGIINGFGTERALCFQLLRTFMPLALKDKRRCDATTLERICPAATEFGCQALRF